MKHNSHEGRKNLRNISFLFFVIIFMAYIVVLLMRIYFVGAISIHDFYDKLLDSLLGIILPIFLVNIAYEYFTKSFISAETSEKVAETIILNKEVIDHFSRDTKVKFIKNCTESILGKVEGEMLYDTLLLPYLNNQYNFRRFFKYYISYTENSGMKEQSAGRAFNRLNFGKEDYHWVRQELSYERNMGNFDFENHSIHVGFSFAENTIEDWFGEDSFFFRENLWLREDHLDELRNSSVEEIKEFADSVLGLSFAFENTELTYEIVNNNRMEGIILKYNIPSALLKKTSSQYKFKIKCRMPQLKSEKKFLVAITEPTYSVDIIFTHYDSDRVRIMPISFFDDGEVLNKLPNDTIRVELQNKWILPRSGIVFVWNDPEENVIDLKHDIQDSIA